MSVFDFIIYIFTSDHVLIKLFLSIYLLVFFLLPFIVLDILLYVRKSVFLLEKIEKNQHDFIKK